LAGLLSASQASTISVWSLTAKQLMGSLYVLFQEITIAKYLTEAKPILPVADVRETGAFFEEKLGFDLVLLSKQPSYGVVKRGKAIIDFGDRRKISMRAPVSAAFMSPMRTWCIGNERRKAQSALATWPTGTIAVVTSRCGTTTETC
tara:strand:- start:71 stop:511 length:441 start_codon:yes stop_codon:yes gene_type:complete